jgi:hypothetical protein
MLDRLQHLRIFLTGSGCDKDKVNSILADEYVQSELNRQPVNPLALLEAMNRVSTITVERHQFSALFGRYRDVDGCMLANGKIVRTKTASR